MKKIALVLFVTLCSSTFCVTGDTIFTVKAPSYIVSSASSPNTSHENNFGKRISCGLAFGIGPNWLNPQSDSLQRKGATAMLKYGIQLDINFTRKENYYFSTGIELQHCGGRLHFNGIPDGDSLIQPLDRKYNAIYITIPTGIKLKTPNIKRWVIAGNFGFQHSFRINATHKDIVRDSGGEKRKIGKKTYTQGETALFRETGYIGLGVEYIIKDSWRVFFYANYLHSFTNFFNPKKSNNLTGGEKDKATHAGVEFQIGICF